MPRQKDQKRRRISLLRRDGNHCAHCGRQGGFRRSGGGVLLTIDHVIPLARGGTYDLTNLQLLCYECNQEKGCSRESLTMRTPAPRQGGRGRDDREGSQ